MGLKSLRMNARTSPKLPNSLRECKRPRVEDPRRLKYIHVHHFKTTMLFGAWFNDPTKLGKKVRLFFGSHLTAYLAARAQDRAALKYKPYALDPQSIKLNFKEEDYVDDQKLRDMLTCEEFGELLRKESRPKYTKMEPTRCLRKFLAHERARGNIPSTVPPMEDIISLHQYLKEVIGKRKQLDEDKADPASTDEESNGDEESSDEEMEDPVPIAKQKKDALKVERKKRSKGKRVVVFTKPRTPRSPVAGPSKCKPLVIKHDPLPVWGQTRKRSKRQEDEIYNLQYKLQKLNIESIKKSREPALPIKPKDLLIEVENTKSLEGAPTESEALSTEVENTKSPEDAPTELDGLSVEVENTQTPKLGNGLPEFPELQFRSRWHYKMHKIQKLQTSRTSAEILPNLPVEVENTKALEPGTEGLPPGPEFPELQFRSRWHYKQHKIQKSQTSRISEPSPTTVEDSCVQALAITLLSPVKKLV